MTPFARVRLISGLGLLALLPAVGLPRLGQAHSGTYVVQSNDSLSAIAYRFHTSLQTLMRLNGIADPNRLLVGQILAVPDSAGAGWGTGRPAFDGESTAAPRTVTGRPGSASLVQPGVVTPVAAGTLASATERTYVVQPGDTLSGLSSRFQVSLLSLASTNGMQVADVLQIGRPLTIPASSFTGARAFTAPQAPVLLATPAPTAVARNTGIPMTSVPSLSSNAAPAMPNVSQAAIGTLLTGTAQSYGVDPALVKAVAWQESGWQMVVARDGGIGVMQLMPATAAWVGPALLGRTINPYNVTDNIQAGVALLASYLRQYGNNVQLALAAYNEGPQNLAQGILPSTAQYTADVLALRAQFAQ